METLWAAIVLVGVSVVVYLALLVTRCGNDSCMTATCYLLAAVVVSTIAPAHVRLSLLRLPRAHFVCVLVAFDEHGIYLICGIEGVLETALALVSYCEGLKRPKSDMRSVTASRYSKLTLSRFHAACYQ